MWMLSEKPLISHVRDKEWTISLGATLERNQSTSEELGEMGRMGTIVGGNRPDLQETETRSLTG